MPIDESKAKLTYEQELCKLSPEFRAAVEKVNERLAKVSRSDLKTRYELGVSVMEAKKAGKDKAGVIGTIAGILECHASTLYDAAKVAETWPKKKFDELCDRECFRGRSLSWSHFVEIASVCDGRARTRWIKRCLEDGLSVRDLSKAMRAASDKPVDPFDSEDDDATTDPTTPIGAVKEMILMLSRIESERKNWREQILKTIEEDEPTALSPIDRELVKEAIKLCGSQPKTWAVLREMLEIFESRNAA